MESVFETIILLAAMGVHVLERPEPDTRGSCEAEGPRKDMGREAAGAITKYAMQAEHVSEGEGLLARSRGTVALPGEADFE